MSSRLAPALLVSAALALAGCAGSSPSATAPVPDATAAPATAEPASPAPTSPLAPSEPAAPSTSPDSGNVDDLPMGPVLSIEAGGRKSILVDLDDLDARAWRIVVSGTGDRADDRLELTVETGDVAPDITLVEIQAGQEVERADLSGYGDPTATAGRCHPSLGVCVDADAIVLPVNGNGHLGVELTRIDEVSLIVTGATAGWPGEPFVLGPWASTEAFPWDPGVTF